MVPVPKDGVDCKVYLLLEVAVWEAQGRFWGSQMTQDIFQKSKPKPCNSINKNEQLSVSWNGAPSKWRHQGGKARCRVVCIVSYNLYREREIFVHTNICTCKAIFWKILKKLVTVAAFAKGDSVSKRCGMKGVFVSTLYPREAFQCCIMYIKYLFKIGNKYKLENNNKTQLKKKVAEPLVETRLEGRNGRQH